TETRRITKFPRSDVVNVLINISDIEERHAAKFPEKGKPDFLIHDQQSIAGLKAEPVLTKSAQCRAAARKELLRWNQVRPPNGSGESQPVTARPHQIFPHLAKAKFLRIKLRVLECRTQSRRRHFETGREECAPRRIQNVVSRIAREGNIHTADPVP